MLRFMGSQRVGRDLAAEKQQLSSGWGVQGCGGLNRMMKEETNKESLSFRHREQTGGHQGRGWEDWGFGSADADDCRGGLRPSCGAQGTVFNFPG